MGRFPAAFSRAAALNSTAAVSVAAAADVPAADELPAADDAAIVGVCAWVGIGARGDDEGESVAPARDDGRPAGNCGSTGCCGVARGDDGCDVGRSASRARDALPDCDEPMDEVFMALPLQKGECELRLRRSRAWTHGFTDSVFDVLRERLQHEAESRVANVSSLRHGLVSGAW
jgi:hypothetical protein